MTARFGKGDRFVFLDALRGIAALAVVFYHLYGVIASDVQRWVPSLVHAVVTHGYLGVPVFFVISGFVISFTVNRDQISWRYSLNFAVRRSLRLDPPYWATIGTGLLLLYAKQAYLGGEPELPAWQTIGAHMVYLQDLLGMHPLSSVFWTLCLEIQLYLFYIAVCWIANYLPRWRTGHTADNAVVLATLTGIYSLLAYYRIVPRGIDGLFLPYWHFFLLGILLCETYKDIRMGRIFAAVLLYEAAVIAVCGRNSNVIAGVIAASVVWLVIRKQLLGTALASPSLQFLGRISYSLYLLHADIGWKITVFVNDAAGSRIGRGAAAPIAFCAGVAGSILAAYCMWALVEQPFNRLSKKLKKPVPAASGSRVPVCTT